MPGSTAADEHPGGAPQDAGAGRRRPPPAARPSGGLLGLRAHRVRRGACARCSTSSRTGARGRSARPRRPRPRAGLAAGALRIALPSTAERADRVPDRRRDRVGRRRRGRRRGASTSPTRRRRRSARLLSAPGRPRPRCRRRRRRRRGGSVLLAALPNVPAVRRLRRPNARRSRRAGRSSRGCRPRRSRPAVVESRPHLAASTSCRACATPRSTSLCTKEKLSPTASSLVIVSRVTMTPSSTRSRNT